MYTLRRALQHLDLATPPDRHTEGITAIPTHLKVRRTMVQQLQHVLDVLRVLDDEVQFHVELPSDELEQRRQYGYYNWPSAPSEHAHTTGIRR
jgi:hypothetical protein